MSAASEERQTKPIQMPEMLQMLWAIRNGSESERSAAFEELQHRFLPLLHKTVERYKAQLPSHGSEDLLQEASITLYRAALGFDTDRSDVTFGSYARVCLHNRFVSLVQAEAAKPKVVTGDVERLTGRAPAPEKIPYRPRTRSERSFVRTAKLLGLPPEPKLAASFRRRLLRRLSPLEKMVFRRFFAGDSYEKIAGDLCKPEKSVDNALSRIRRKAKELRSELAAEK